MGKKEERPREKIMGGIQSVGILGGGNCSAQGRAEGVQRQDNEDAKPLRQL